jgi:hypothetical protein
VAAAPESAGAIRERAVSAYRAAAFATARPEAEGMPADLTAKGSPCGALAREALLRLRAADPAAGPPSREARPPAAVREKASRPGAVR